MPQLIIFLDEKENDKIEDYSKKWKLSKVETIKRFIKDFEEKK